MFETDAVAALIEHRFNRYNHTRFQLHLATGSVVEDERVFMIVRADAVPAVIANDTVHTMLSNVFNCSADVVESCSRLAYLNTGIKRFFACRQEVAAGED